MHRTKTILKYIALLFVLLAEAIGTFINFAPVFGANPQGDSLAKFNASSGKLRRVPLLSHRFDVTQFTPAKSSIASSAQLYIYIDG